MKDLLSGLIGMIIGTTIFSVFFTLLPVHTQIQPNIIQQPSCINIFDEISSVADNVSNSHEYKINKYDCTDFSRDLVKELNRTWNVSAYCVFGIIKGEFAGNGYKLFNPLHTWVGINISGTEYYIEATAGYIVPNNSMNNYKMIKRGICL